MVTIDPKLTAAARLAQNQAMQRLLVLQATRAGMETLMKAGGAAPPPATPPRPERLSPDLGARLATAGATIQPVRHLPGDVARAYAQADGDFIPAAGRGILARRTPAEAERVVLQPRADGSPQTAAINGTMPTQGLVGVAPSSRRGDASEDEQGRVRSWSLKWWGPSESKAAVRRIPVPIRRRVAIAAALVLLGLILASML